MLDKQAYEDAREYQIAMEHERRARAEAEQHLSMAREAQEAWEAFKHHDAGFFKRWMLRGLGL